MTWGRGKVIKTMAGLFALSLTIRPMIAQTQYEWVPGSRQARPVSPGYPQGQIYQPGSGQTQYYQSGQRAPAQSYQYRTVPRPAAQSETPNSRSQSYHYMDSVTVDGMARQFQVHIPASYDRSKATPVVLVFHGLHMNGTMMVGMTGFNGLSERKGFIVVYGEAAAGRWSDGRTASGVDDIAYVGALLDRLGKVANIDRRRIYACGISNGGYFSQVLACAIPDKIAAVGSVGSTLMEQTTGTMQSGKPVPIVFFLGTDDPLIPWGDGRVKDLGKLGEILGLSSLGSIDNSMVRMGGLLNVQETIAFWTAHNHASTTPYVSQEADRDPKDGTRVKKEEYGSGNNAVVLYTIEGGGHTWPGCINLKAISGISGNISQDISASELLWDFFRNRSL